MDPRDCKYFDFECTTCEGCEHFESQMSKYQKCNNCGEQFRPTENSRIELENNEFKEYHKCPTCAGVNIKIDDKRIAHKTGSFY
ncbi:hypothetical protein [Candidatus Bathycorpusculum sp.]|jgi:PHP family Zn ribbon phosphoesterase|uniref:hypothetical protein n=1 Tax=Candidatus Bathycorpusculum sp. TaxID=2994959 RepID=UPI00281AC759|nr:hypothetical protein [Candidatus Termitimicrobium sp.]MCL2684965.1 hypothetical protein [Candidatus Termitimicrobium sp.]